MHLRAIFVSIVSVHIFASKSPRERVVQMYKLREKVVTCVIIIFHYPTSCMRYNLTEVSWFPAQLLVQTCGWSRRSGGELGVLIRRRSRRKGRSLEGLRSQAAGTQSHDPANTLMIKPIKVDGLEVVNALISDVRAERRDANKKWRSELNPDWKRVTVSITWTLMKSFLFKLKHFFTEG